MKTKDLIKKLQEIDPKGEADVCVHNSDIMPFFHLEPAYWDGRLERISKSDESGYPIETTIETGGAKIKIIPLDLNDHFIDCIIDYCTEYQIITDRDGVAKGWLGADWLFRKMKWTHEALWHLNGVYKVGGELTELYDDKQKKIDFANGLIQKYKQQSKNQLYEEAKSLSDKKIKANVLLLLDKIFSLNVPVVCDCIRHGSKYVSIQMHYGKTWHVYKNKIMITENFGRDEYEFDIDSYDWNALCERCIELYN